MILQALVSCYEALAKQGKIAQLGWSPVKVSYALELNDAGEIANIIALKQPDPSGKKMIAQTMRVPEHPVRSGKKPKPYFLCDLSAHILGVTIKDNSVVLCEDYFKRSAAFHHSVLDGFDDPSITAFLKFMDTWEPKNYTEIADSNRLKELLGGANLVFLYHGQYVHDIPMFKTAWEQYRDSCNSEERRVCLVTGSMAPTAEIHPHFSGISDKSAALVSFNDEAYCSYGRKSGDKGLNAPTSEYAAFAYGAALNYLISTQRTRIGDTTVLFWAETAEEQYRSIMDFCLRGDVPDRYSAQDLQSAVKSLCAGQSVEFDELRLDPEMQFYLLGISPNAARLSVRFFLRSTFGSFLRNIREHQARLEIVHSKSEPFETVPLWRLLSETVNQNSRDKTPVPNMAGETLRAILNNTPYPATLLNGVELRIRADREVNRYRAAIIKAYYLKKPHSELPKEVLQVSLNHECRDTAYVLGRLFSVLESIQNAANPGINTTIRDKYFSSASATPAVVFPTLINLAMKHLKKLDGGLKVSLEKQLTELLGMLEQSYPAHLSLPQQGAFQLGYYHQTAIRYMKKEDK